jgi:heme exporter protein C
MREKATWLLALLGALVMIYNLRTIFTGLPDDALQGMIFRIIFIHVPADLVADIFYTVALVTSIMFLARKNFLYDSITVSCIEVATMLILVNLVTGSVWGRNQWGVWWTWDLRLTTQLMKFVLYLGYLIIRPAISEPTQRATMSSIVAIFAYADVPMVWMAIRLPNVRTNHPSPVLGNGKMAAVYNAPFGMGMLALLLFGTALVLVRLHQETSQREIDSLRRELHAI